MTHVDGTEQFLSGDEWFIFKFDKQQVCQCVGVWELGWAVRCAVHNGAQSSGMGCV